MAKVEFYAESKQLPDKKTVEDVLEKESGLSIQYTDGTEKSIEVATGSGGVNGAGSTQVRQITKMNVVAPKEVKIPVEPISTFAFPPVEILKFKAGETNANKTLCDFSNDDSADFAPNEMIQFDGTMKLVTDKILEESGQQIIADGVVATIPVDKNKLGSNLTFSVI